MAVDHRASKASVSSPADIPFLKNDIGFDQEGDPFIVNTPQALCCNCGTRSALQGIDTHFEKKAVFSTNFDDRQTIALALPYCAVCADRVGKYPTSRAIVFLIGFVLWFVASMGLVTVFPGRYAWMRLIEMLLPMVPVVLLFRALGRPKAPMTARYAPVKIKEFEGQSNSVRYGGASLWVITAIAGLLGAVIRMLSNKNPNAIEVLSIKFSNADYAKAFRKDEKPILWLEGGKDLLVEGKSSPARHVQSKWRDM